MAVQTVIKHRRDTAANWTSVNPVLAAGEAGLETDTKLVKYGDGSTAWTSLPYQKTGVVTGGTTGQFLTKVDGTDFNTTWSSTAPSAGYTSVIKHEVKLGESIAKGQAVYVSSSNGTNMVVSKASNASETTSSKTMGLLETGGSTNAFVNVITEGLLTGLNTASATAGDAVWLGTSGNLIFWHYGGSTTKPSAPAHLVYIGTVTRVHATNGEIFVKVQNGYELEELHNVSITNPATGDVLTYDSVSGLWINSEGGTGSASITVSDTAPADPQADSMWWNSAEGTAYIRYDNTWVPLSVGIAGPIGPRGYSGLISQATAPGDTSVLWMDTADTASQVAIPAGGTAGQILAKTTGTDYATNWVEPTNGTLNAIINGSMEISQRGTSFSFGSGGGTTYYPADRWFTGNYQWSSGSNLTVSNDTSIYPTGFNASAKIATGSTGLTITTGGSIYLRTHLEGYNISSLYKQSAVTLSFWVRSSVTGTYSILFDNGWWGSGTSTRAIMKEYTVNVANTWEKKTITIDFSAGTASGTWNTTNSIGLGIQFNLGANADRIGNAYLNNWADWSSYQVQSSSSVNWATNANATFYVTGVQLEAGSVASPFKRNTENIQQELAACQRYAVMLTGSNSSGWGMVPAFGFSSSTSRVELTVLPPVPLRKIPDSIAYSGMAVQSFTGSGVVTTPSAILIDAGASTNAAVAIVFDKSGGFTTGYGFRMLKSGNGNDYILLSAEL
jgi:hypothetical protein